MTDFSDIKRIDEQLRMRPGGDPAEIQPLLIEFSQLPDGHPRKIELLEQILLFNEKYEIK